MDNLQSIAALTIVALTLAIFAYRIFRKKPGGCGGGCACSMKPSVPEIKGSKSGRM